MPEGMWLAETAVNTETLDLLAEYGIKFTVLAPRQARRVRPIGGGGDAWENVEGARVDPRRPYRCMLPSGRTIDIFFYDGHPAQEIAFSNLLENGEWLAQRLIGTLSPDFPEPQLANIATDGETYGHHRRFGEMALATCLRTIESAAGVDLWRRRESLGEFELFHVAVLAFVLGTAAAGGLFRGGMSPLEALNKKYAPTAVLAWGSLASLGLRRAGPWLLGAAAGPAWRRLGIAAALTLAIVPGDLVEYRAWNVWKQELHQAAASYAAGDRSDSLIRRFFENVNMGRQLLAPIAADGGYCFARAEQLAAEARSVPAAVLTESGRIERVPDHTDYSLESINDHPFPLGKPPARISRERPLTVAGWAIDREAGQATAGVELVVGDRGFETRYGLPRPDVAEYFKQPGLVDSGFRGMLPAGTLPPGEYTLRLRLRLSDGEHFLETPGYPVIVE